MRLLARLHAAVFPFRWDPEAKCIKALGGFASAGNLGDQSLGYVYLPSLILIRF